MFLCLRERKDEFWCYDGFVARRIDMKVSFENFDVKTFMAMCDFWGLKYCDEKLYGDVVLRIVRVITIE